MSLDGDLRGRLAHRRQMTGMLLAGLALAVAGATAVGYLAYRRFSPTGGRLARLSRSWDDPLTHAVWTIRAGTLVGYQGNYSADLGNPTGMHLHFSIVLDDGRGSFLNELDIGNTLDPSPYLGIEVDSARVGDGPAVCPGKAAGGSDEAARSRADGGLYG